MKVAILPGEVRVVPALQETPGHGRRGVAGANLLQTGQEKTHTQVQLEAPSRASIAIVAGRREDDVLDAPVLLPS